MDDVQNYILDREGEEQAILQYLHDMLTSFTEVTATIRYKIPFYYRKNWVLYLNPQKKGGIEICFIYGQRLSNDYGLLETKERKQVAGITIKKISEIPEEKIFEIIQEAFLIDDLGNKK
jgi:hypothetical protein